MRFAPTATGARNASLNLTSDAPGRFTTVTLTGTRTAAPTGPAVRSHPRGVLASLSAHRTRSVKQALRGIRVHAVLAAPGTADLRLERLGGRRAKTLAHTQASRALAGTLILHLKPRRLAAGRYRVVATPVIDGVLDRGASVSLALRITRRL